MAQPQLNTDFIDELFNNTTRKFLDNETKSQAEKIIQAYIKRQPIDGLINLANFYIYFNEPEKAIDLINDCIQKYGETYSYSNCLSIAYTSLGDMDNYIKSINSCLSLNNKKLQVLDTKQYIHNRLLTNLNTVAILYLNDSESVLSYFNSEHKMQMIKKIHSSQTKLYEMGISLNTYQKFMNIVNQVVHKYYVRGFKFLFQLDSELDIAELGIYFDEISPHEAFELTDEIDNAVLDATINDEVFAKEVRKLIVYCTLAEEGELA